MDVIVLGFFLVFLSASAHAEGEEVSFLNDTNAMECRKDYKIDDEDMEELLIGNYPDNEEIKCFVRCWYEKSGFVNESGQILEAALRAYVVCFEKSQALIEQLDQCKNATVDSCENAYEFDKCLMKAVEM